MPNGFEIKDGVLKRYYGTETDVVIPDGVRIIGKYAFDYTHLKTIVIPESVTEISEHAFAGLSELESITIPSSVKEIGYYAFFGCSKLNSVEIMGGVNNIGESAFSRCESLISVDIRGGVLKIGDSAFSNCRKLTSVKLPRTVKVIEDFAFSNCVSLNSFTVPDSVIRIGESAFGHCKNLTSLIIPFSVAEIGELLLSGSQKATVICQEYSYAHEYCIENKLVFIFDYQYKAFHGLLPQGFQKLKSPFLADEEKPYIFISYSHKDRDAVLGIIKNLYESGWRIWYDEGLTVGDKYDETLEEHVRDCEAFLLFITENSLQSMYVRENEIPWAIEFNKPIVKCILDKGLDFEIKNDAVISTVPPSDIEYVLNSIGKLTKGEPREAKGISVVFDPSERDAANGNGFAYCLYTNKNSASAKAILLEAKNNGCSLYNAFEDGENEEKLKECACLIVFLDKAFLADKRLTKLLIKEFQAGRDMAICQLEEIEDTELPKELLSLHKMQWLNFLYSLSGDMNMKLARHLQKRGCRNTAILPGFEYEKTDKGIVIKRYNGMDTNPRIEKAYGDVYVTEIAAETFKNHTQIKDVIIPGSVERIGKRAFENCIELESVVIENGVKVIGERAFYKCESLESIVLPDSVTYVDTGAFEDCTNLTSVKMSSGITEIGMHVFDHCVALKNINIPDGVTIIDVSAFRDCKNLPSVKIPDSVTVLDRSAFEGCKNLISVSIPNSVKEIGFSLFCSCDNLTSITIPDGINEIPPYAFAFCESLTSVTIPDSVKVIGWYAFDNCTSLKSVTIPCEMELIDEGAFMKCSALTSITIPNSVAEIKINAFKDCPNLTVTCSPDSCAWKYCMENGIPVKAPSTDKEKPSRSGLLGKK